VISRTRALRSSLARTSGRVRVENSLGAKGEVGDDMEERRRRGGAMAVFVLHWVGKCRAHMEIDEVKQRGCEVEVRIPVGSDIPEGKALLEETRRSASPFHIQPAIQRSSAPLVHG